MEHGTAAWFEERAENARRLVVINVVLAAVLLAPFKLSETPPLRAPAQRLRQSLRFGVLGETERYVRRIRLEALPGREESLHDVGKVTTHSTRRGGDPAPRLTRPARGVPEDRPRLHETGESLEDLLARSVARRSDVPIVPPDQLVIEKLVRPVYPEEARERNIEGRVRVLALVDTSGLVVEVDIVGDAGHESLARAAVTAVWQCRFQPYRVAGRPREVYVVMPFNFTIY